MSDDIRTSLLSCHGKTVTFRGHSYKIECREWQDGSFHLDATDLTPRTPEETKYCVWDLWRSESLEASQFISKLCALANAETAAPVASSAFGVFPKGRW